MREMIYQANALTSGRYDFSPTEKNVFYKIAQKVRNTYVEGTMIEKGWQNLIVKLNSADFAKIADENHTQRAKKALRSLRHRDIEIEDAEGNWLNVGYINYAKFLAKENTYEVEVSKEIMPYLVELVKNFTSYSITVAMALRSKYSQRLYELCCQYKAKQGFFLTQEQLRAMLKCENLYKNNKDFRRCIIEVAKKELEEMFEKEKSDLYFSYTSIGKGEGVTYYFSVFSKSKKATKKILEREREYMEYRIFEDAKKIFKEDPDFVNRIFFSLKERPGIVFPLYVKFKSKKGKYKIDDLPFVFRKILKDDFKIE